MKRIIANDFYRASAIASLVTALITIVSPALANEVPKGKQNQDGAEILDKGGVIEDKYVPTPQPGPNYPADDKILQRDAEKAKAKAAEEIIRRDQDEAFVGEYDDVVSWPEDYWYWPYSLYP